MLNRLLLGLLALVPAVFLHGTGHPSFPELLENYYEEYLPLFPLDAATYGDSDPRYEDVWPDEADPAHRAQVRALCDKYLAALATFDRTALGESERLSYDTLQWLLAARRDRDGHFLHLLPVNQFTSAHLTFAQLGAGHGAHPFKSERDYRNFILRARGFARWVDSAIVAMREGMARGIVPPRVLIERTLPQLEPLMTDAAGENVLFQPLALLPADLPADRRATLASDYRAAIREVMIPAYVRLHTFLQDEYLARCRDTAGFGALPGGAEAYASLVRWHTTTDLTPAQIHEIGLREVARIRGEMARVQQRVGFPGSLADFLNHVATDARFTPFTSEEEILNAYRAIEARVMVGVPRFFTAVPRSPLEVRATEKFRAASAAAEYAPGAADGSRPGVFYVPILDPRKFRNVRMEDLFLHEAIPGHHFQLSLTIENERLPRFRRFDGNNAYVEGWALYAESLGPELGLLADPYQYLGMLTGELHRAVRLVVDTGLHAQGWTREQALAYSAETEGGRPTDQKHVAEVERYMAWPGQALGYKLGQLRIRELRTRAEQALGPKFSLPAFHRCVLEEGPLPLAVLEARVDGWIARQQHP